MALVICFGGESCLLASFQSFLFFKKFFFLILSFTVPVCEHGEGEEDWLEMMYTQLMLSAETNRRPASQQSSG